MNSIHLKIPALTFKLVGFWPIQFDSKLSNYLYKVYHALSLLITVGMICLQYMEIPNMIQIGFVKLVAITATCSQFTIGLIKFYMIRRSTAQKLLKTIEVTERNILHQEEDEVKEIYLRHVKQNHRVNKLWLALCLMCDIIFLAAPWLLEVRLRVIDEDFSDLVVDGYKERPLPLESWLPFNKFKYYKTAYVWNIVGGVYNTIFIVGSDSVYFSLMIFGISQLDLLKAEFQNAINKSKEGEVGINLRKAIIYHKNITRYVKELNSIMNGFLFLANLICILQVAIITFQIAVEEPSFEMAKNAYYLMAIIVELMLFYWHGNEICLASLGVIDAIANSNWYKLDNSTRKTLIFVMLRAKQQLKLNVGPFYHMSTETMLMIFKSAISYSAAIRSIYARKAAGEIT